MANSNLDTAFNLSRKAYSFDRYGQKNWIANIEWLLTQGLTARQAAGIMMSKVTRWAADAAGNKNLNRTLSVYYNGNKSLVLKDVKAFRL